MKPKRICLTFLMLMLISFSTCLIMPIVRAEPPKEPPPPEGSEPPPEENPIIMIDVNTESFNVSFVEEGLIISFMNQSKESEAIDIVIYVELYGLMDVSSFDLKVDNGALINRSLIDLCDKDLNFLGSYGSFEIGNSTANINIDGNNLILQAKDIDAHCAKFTITINNWSPSVKYNLTVRPEFQGGPPEPPPMEGEVDVYVLYDAQGGFLYVFNVSSTEEGMDIFFSNASATAETIDILIYTGIEAVQYISGFNATMDNGAKIVEGSIDLCDDNLTLIENYQTFDLGNGVTVHSVHFDPENLIERINNFNASFVRFRMTIGDWDSSILYTLHIQPFFRETLYYETEDAVYVDPSTLDLPPELRVWWQRYNDTRNDNWMYQDVSWEFGPSAHYEIFCYNSSSGFWYKVMPETWIMFDSDVKINATIPKLLFEDGTELGQFEIHWNMWAVNISASLSIHYFATDGRWDSHSYIQNYSMPGGYPEPHMDGTAEFFTLNENRTHVRASADYYNIEITGQFNDLTPKGIYYVDFNIYDNKSNYIRGCSYFPEMGTSKQVAMGGPWSEVAVYQEKMLGGTYTAWIMNTDHDSVHSVGFNETFIIKVDVIGLLDSNLANVSVLFPLPWDMKSYINVTGWHEEYRVYHGGWIYNKTLKNYVWDPNATIITREWVPGSYLEETWEDWSSYHKEVNVTRWEWNGTHYNQRIWMEHIPPKILIFYDNLNESFGSYFVYEYYNDTLMEDEKGKWVSCERHIEIEETPTEIMFYQLLNVTKKIEENNVTIEFEGKFIKKLTSDLWLDYHVFSVEREIWPNWELMEENARFISIEKPTITVRIFDDKGDGSQYGDYVTDPGEWFIIEAKTEGSSDLRTDADGIRIRFECDDHYWSETETIWSRLEIVTTVNLRESTYTTMVYNETCRSVYEYGTYEIWNETTGRIEEVETWHWEYYTMNQTSGEWVKGGLQWHSDDMTVNGTYLTVNDFEAFTTDDGRYIVQVNMSFIEQADDHWYHFDLTFLNWTYGPDYSKPWGEYLSEDWVYTTVYTVNNGSVEVYVPKPEEKNYVEDSEGTKYLIFSKPYIKINGEKLSLKEIKYWMGSAYEYRLLQENWDYTTGQQKRYYTLENNTRIYVFEAYKAPIYNATLSNGETVLTCMEWDGWDKFNNKHFLIALNGTLIWLEEGTHLVNVNETSKVPVEFAGYFVLINGTRWENVTNGWFDWDWRVGRNYMDFTNGTRVYLEYDDAYMYSWYFEKDGERYYVDWPWEYYSGNYSGSTIVVPGWCRRAWYYTLVNGEKVEVPYTGVSSEYSWLSWWDLGRTKSEGGPVPEDDYALVNGSLYPVNYYEGFDLLGFIVVEGEVVNVTKDRSLYTNVMGNDVWDVAEIGFTMFLANLTEHGSYDMEHLIELQVANYFHYSNDNITLVLLNDTSLTAQNRIRVMFYELKLNETIYHVANYKPFFNYTTGTYVFYLLNGSKIEIPESEEYEIVKTIAKDIGVNQWPIPKNFTWQGETYNTTLIIDSMGWIELWYTYYCVDANDHRYDVVPISVLQKTFTPWDEIVPRYPNSEPWNYREKFTIYNATLNSGATYTLYPRLDHIRVILPSWGHPYGWHLEEFPWESIAIRKQTNNIIVGAPEWGLWGYKSFKIVPETGALDLDGDLNTTDDQFYVKRVYNGGYSFTETRNGLDVHLVYDPNPVIPEDELIVDAWMGIATNTYRNTWNETYFWYYPNMTLVSPETMSLINETIWDIDRNAPNPGYWDILCMTINMTWEDYLTKAKKEGWHWVDEEATWTWLWFGFEQTYWASEENENETFQSYNVRLRYEYAGMFVYNDTNRDSMMVEGEETHYFMPNAVSNVTFITPGAALGDYNETGMLVLPANESLEFGVSYLGINGTMFPFGRSYYAWYGEDISGTDLGTFTERPVDAALDELSFKIHSYVENSTETNSTKAHIKIDQHIGDWTLDIPSNIAVLENLSLSLNYYVHAEMSGSWSVTGENGSSIDPNDIVEASRLSFDVSGLKFADVNMGDTYIWGGNLTMPYNVSSYTVPLNTFIDTYTSYGSETSVGGWTFQSTMYFLSVGFPTWDGHYVYEDPEVVLYFGNGKRTIIGSPKEFLLGWNLLAIQPGGGEEQPGPEEPEPEQPSPMEVGEPLWMQWWFITLIGAVAAAVAVTLIVFRKRV